MAGSGTPRKPGPGKLQCSVLPHQATKQAICKVDEVNEVQTRVWIVGMADICWVHTIPKSLGWRACRGGAHAEWELVLDDVYEAILGHLQPADVAVLRSVCRCLRAKTDMLLRTLRLSRPHVKQAAARFQVHINDIARVALIGTACTPPASRRCWLAGWC